VRMARLLSSGGARGKEKKKEEALVMQAFAQSVAWVQRRRGEGGAPCLRVLHLASKAPFLKRVGEKKKKGEKKECRPRHDSSQEEGGERGKNQEYLQSPLKYSYPEGGKKRGIEEKREKR